MKKTLILIYICILCSCSHAEHYITVQHSPDFSFENQKVVVIAENRADKTIFGQKIQKSTEDFLREIGFNVLSYNEYDELNTFCMLKIISAGPRNDKDVPEKCAYINRPLIAVWNYKLRHTDQKHYSVYGNSINEYTTTDWWGAYYIAIKQGDKNLIESDLIIDTANEEITKSIIEKAYKQFLLQNNIRTEINCNDDVCKPQ